MSEGIPVSSLPDGFTGRALTPLGTYNPVLIQQELNAQRKTITEETEKLKRQTSTAAEQTKAAAESTAAVAKQMAEAAKAAIESTMKALGDLNKSDPTALLEL